jgi:hypothetical protein
MGGVPPPHTPLVDVVEDTGDWREGVEWGEQPSGVTDVRDWVEGFVDRVKEVEKRLIEGRRREVRETTGDEFQELMEEANSLKTEASQMTEKGKVNEELRRGEEEEDARVGPIPATIAQKPEPVWVAIPLKADDIDYVMTGEKDERKGAPDVISPLDVKQGKGGQIEGQHVSGEATPSHVRKELPEDHPIGTPIEERGAGKQVPLRGPTRRTSPRP